MESYSTNSKLDLSNSLLASNESSPQSSNGDQLIKRKSACSSGSSSGGGNLIPTSMPGLTSDLSSLYALENLHHHHHSSAGLGHHSQHAGHHHNLIGSGGNASISSIAPSTSTSQGIQSGSILGTGNLGLTGKHFSRLYCIEKR